MKIGILTFHWANNYGAVIQSHALFEALKNYGHEPIMINLTPYYHGYIRRLYHKVSFEHFWSWLRFHSSAQKLFLQTEHYAKSSLAHKCVDKYALDAIVVGSDQVWKWIDYFGYDYFLGFLKDEKVRRISYAASFGQSKWIAPDIDTQKIKNLLSKFVSVSVRETSGIKICKDVFQIEAELVVDPTLLHDAYYYIEKFKLFKNTHKTLVSYILGKNKAANVKRLNEYSKNNDFDYTDLYMSKMDFGLFKNVGLPIFHYTIGEWLNYIYNADIIITNSFHATVFSLLFHKKFLVLTSDVNGLGRIKTLLDGLPLENVYINSIKDLDRAHPSYDYAEIDKIFQHKRELSKSFLTRSLT